jgi:hypothetical protein
MRSMRALPAIRALALAAAGLAAWPCQAQDPETDAGIPGALAAGRPVLEVRPRYNRIEESNFPETTEGGTMRTILGWRTAPWRGWRADMEGIVASHIGAERFNDNPARISTSPYPLLPDPEYKGVNQAYLDYDGDDDGLRLRLGRQVARLENQRWVSDNDFRQIPQVFEGGAFTYAGIENFELGASYFDHVRTTSGVTNALRLTLLRAAWNPAPGHSLVAYGVLHDQAQNGAFTGFADNSYRVVGIKAEGTAWRVGGIEIPYVADYAQQRRYAGGDSRIDADYWRLGAGLAARDWTVRYDHEVKGSNQGAFGVQMPLTDFYRYNGWTLNFFTTPRQGLHDDWLTLRAAWRRLTLYGEAHRFHSDFGSLDFGRENDIGLTVDILDGLTARLQHARYDPGGGLAGASIRKTWLTVTYVY